MSVGPTLGRKRLVWFGVALLLGAAGLTWYRLAHLGNYKQVPLARCPYLKDVVEPIVMTEGMSFSDGGSLGLAFRDARGETYTVGLPNPFDQPGPHRLGFGRIYPGGGPVPIGGVQERAFIGLLQRWLAGDPEAQPWNKEDARRRIAESTAWREDPSLRAKVTALVLLRKLLSRN